MNPRICIFGAGAIGGWIGTRLHQADQNVTLIVRGEHYEAIAQHGLTCIENNESQVHRIPVTNDPFSLPEQDVVMVTSKAHSIPPAVNALKHLIGEHGFLVTAVNGLPWWYFYGLKPPYTDHPLVSVDPDGELWNKIGPHRTLGCVVYPSVEVVAPGTIRHNRDNRLPIGEPSGETTDRIQRIADILEEAKIRAPIRRNIRNEIWLKLWGNLAFNPMSVLTGALLDEIATDEGTREIAKQIMQELLNVGEKLGVRFGVTIEKRMAGAAAVGPHKTSMLHDFDAGKALETGAIIDTAVEVAELVDVPIPTIHMIDALLKQRIKTRNLNAN